MSEQFQQQQQQSWHGFRHCHSLQQQETHSPTVSGDVTISIRRGLATVVTSASYIVHKVVMFVRVLRYYTGTHLCRLALLMKYQHHVIPSRHL